MQHYALLVEFRINEIMELKLNKSLSIILIIVFVAIIFFGLNIILPIVNLVSPENPYNLTFLDLIIPNLTIVISYSKGIIIGLWLYVNANEFHQDKLTWLLIGLIFGQYGLILFGMLLIIQNEESNVNLFNSLKPVLTLLIITFFFNPLTSFLFKPYMTRMYGLTEYAFITEYKTYLVFALYGIMILMNFIFAFKLKKLVITLGMKGKTVWIIATIFLGLFPVILFNELIIINHTINTLK